MAFVPISMEELETVVSDTARDLLEKWAIDGEIEDHEMDEYASLSVETVAYVIDSFMTYVNTLMEEKERGL